MIMSKHEHFEYEQPHYHKGALKNFVGNSFNMQFASILNGFGQKIKSDNLNRVFKFELNTCLYYVTFCRTWLIC